MIRKANDGNVILSGVPEIPAEITERLKPYQNTRYATFVDWLANGREIFISTRLANIPQLHHVAMPAGMRRQLTFEDEPIRDARRRPGTDQLLFPRDVGGGEFYQLFLFDPGTGKGRMLTDGDSRNTSPLWSPAGDRLAFTSTRRDGRSNDIWILDPDDPDEPELVLEAPDGSAWVAADWHPDGKHLLVEQYVSITDSRVHLLDLTSGETERLLGGDDAEASYEPVGFNAAGTRLFLTTDRFGEFTQLAVLELGSGELEVLTDDIPWNVEFSTHSRARDRFAFTANENGTSTLYLLDPESNGFRQVTEVPDGVIYGLVFNHAGDRLGLSLDTGVAPSEAYTLEIGGPLDASGCERWTFSEVGGLDASRFVAPQPIHYPTFDDREIPAFLYLPEGDGPHPVIVNIHGGPEGQSRRVFYGVFQSWISELGAAVLNPNVRGSSGYGKSYLKLDNGMLREDSVRDIGALLDWIAEHPKLDEDRVMVYGGSYGGYMVLASLIHFGDRLKAGVDIVGISDFITFLENTQDYRRDLRRVEYGDERDPEMRAFFERVSPLRNASKIRSPLFVIQGQNDPRVPVSEAEQIVEQVRENGRDVWYMNALNEGHGYARKENQDLMRDAVMMFMMEHL